MQPVYVELLGLHLDAWELRRHLAQAIPLVATIEREGPFVLIFSGRWEVRLTEANVDDELAAKHYPIEQVPLALDKKRRVRRAGGAS